VINLADDSPTFQQKYVMIVITFVLCLLSIFDMFIIDESDHIFLLFILCSPLFVLSSISSSYEREGKKRRLLDFV
jgi:hypothetical protein